MKIKLPFDCEVWSKDLKECITVLSKGMYVEYKGHLPGGNVLIEFGDNQIGVVSGSVIQ